MRGRVGSCRPSSILIITALDVLYYVMRIVKQRGRSLLWAGLMGAFLWANPGIAAELEMLRFDSDASRLTFATDAEVRPRARLIFNPTRLVIDLPGVDLDGETGEQAGQGAVREVRFGQFNATTARLVVELEPGFTYDPEEIRIFGRSPGQWEVQLPDPIRIADLEDRPSSSSIVATEQPESSELGAASILEAVEVASYGLYLRIDGEPVPVDVRQARRDRRILITLPNTRLEDAIELDEDDLAAVGISEFEAEQQDDTDLPQVRLTLELADPATWQATQTAVGDIVLQPGRAIRDAAEDPPDEPTSSDEAVPDAEAPAPPAPLGEVEAIAFRADRSALQIRSSDAIPYDITRDGNRYRIRFRNARLGPLQPLDLSHTSRLAQVDWQQVEDDVEVVFEAAGDIRVGTPIEESVGFGQGGDRLLLFPLERGFWEPGSPLPPVQMPDIGNRRITLVLDPGHGGRDPGAVGIRGLREVDVVNDVVPQVAAILEAEGVRVVLTRTDNRTLDLEPRVALAERVNARLFISIHANAISLSRPDVNGIETFHASASGRVLAAAIQDSLIEATGSPSRGVKSARFYVIRRTSMPAALVEVGFVTGAEDIRRLENSTYRRLLAQAIARGILQYIQDNL